MNTNLIETLKETLGDPTQLNPEKLKKLIDETMSFFQEIQGKFDSKDPKQREDALAAAGELKQALEIQMESLAKMTGLDPTQMASLAEHTSYTPEEKEALDDMKAKLQTFQSPAAKSAPRKKAPKLRLIG